MNSPNTTDVPNAAPDPEPFTIDTRAVADTLRTFCEAKYRNDPDWRERFDAWLAGIRAAAPAGSGRDQGGTSCTR